MLTFGYAATANGELDGFLNGVAGEATHSMLAVTCRGCTRIVDCHCHRRLDRSTAFA